MRVPRQAAGRMFDWVAYPLKKVNHIERWRRPDIAGTTSILPLRAGS